MRILTHNYLQSNVKGTDKGYPLKIHATKVLIEEAPMDADLVRKLLPKLNYDAVVAARADLAETTTLPELPATLPDDTSMSTASLEALHQVLFNVHILEGELECPDTGRKFPIKQGIPNMILHADEL